MHLLKWDQVAAIDEEDCRQESGDHRGVAEPLAYCANGSEELHETQRCSDDDDPEGEETTRVHLKCGHEVQDE